jgi:hypothetical protein
MGFLMAVCFHGKTFSRGREQLQKERRRHLEENNMTGEKKSRKHRKHHDDDSYDSNDDDNETATDDIKIEYKINERSHKQFKSKNDDNNSNKNNKNRYLSGKHNEKVDQKGNRERDIEIGVLNKFTKTKNIESKIDENQMTRHAGKLWKEKMQKNKNKIINNANNVNASNYVSSSPTQQLQFNNFQGKNNMDYIHNNNNFMASSSHKNVYNNNFSSMNNMANNSMGNMNNIGNMNNMNNMGNMNDMGNMNYMNNMNNMTNMFIPNTMNNSKTINTTNNTAIESNTVGTSPNKAPRSLRDAVNRMQDKNSSPGFSSVVRSVSPSNNRNR